MEIRSATDSDFEAIWPIFQAVVSAGDSYGFDPQTSREEAHRLWMQQPEATFVASDGDAVVGTYFLKPNMQGPGRHVCNCGYMVAAAARGRGIAAAMCQHSQTHALSLGYKAMQFNFVAASNERAWRLWQRLGFDTVGRLPGAFEHPQLGYVDALVMYKWLDPATAPD